MPKEVNLARIYLANPKKIKDYIKYLKNTKTQFFSENAELAKDLKDIEKKLNELDKGGRLDIYKDDDNKKYKVYPGDYQIPVVPMSFMVVRSL